MFFFRLLNKENLALLISIILSLILFFNSNAKSVVSVQSDLADFFNIITYPKMWYQDIFTIKETNKYLQRKLVKSELQLARFKNHKIENIKLREMLDFKDSNPWTLIPANVIDKSSSSIKAIFIDIGSDDSIYQILPVLDIHGLIGRVFIAGKNSSKVQLINDKNFCISIRIGEDNSLANFIPTVDKYGILQGVRKSMNLSVGEIAYTSGISDIYPANIPIAKVLSVNTDNNSPFQDVVVEILENLNNLNYVFVIQ